LTSTDKIDREAIWKRIEEIRKFHSNPERLKALLEAWDNDFGPEYNDIAREILAENVRKNSGAWSKQKGLTTAEDIVKDMWEGWGEGEFTIERKEDGIQIYCTKCPIADTYLSIGRKEQGLIFQCSEDPHIVAGGYPKIGFRRTRTLMNGDDCCDNFYSYSQQ